MKKIGLLAGVGRLPVEFARAARGMGFQKNQPRIGRTSPASRKNQRLSAFLKAAEPLRRGGVGDRRRQANLCISCVDALIFRRLGRPPQARKCDAISTGDHDDYPWYMGNAIRRVLLLKHHRWVGRP